MKKNIIIKIDTATAQHVVKLVIIEKQKKIIIHDVSHHFLHHANKIENILKFY